MNTQIQPTKKDGPAGSLALDPRSAPSFFFLPNMPRDIWYGYEDKPEHAELAAFIHQRHAHISPSCDAEIFCHALNGAPHFDRQTLELVRLHALLRECAAELRTQAESRGEKFNRDAAGELAAKVESVPAWPNTTVSNATSGADTPTGTSSRVAL